MEAQVKLCAGRLPNYPQATLEAYQMAIALVKLARNQIMMDARIGNNEVQLTHHEQRL